MSVFLPLMVVVWAAASLSAEAQEITGSGLGTNVQSILNGQGTEHQITGGTRAGTNLFHSFGRFNVGELNVANFLNETGLPTSNILSRVTGNEVSSIFGMIKTTNFGATNLFLMNPAGVVFGPNASLQVGGSFYVTNADYIRFANGEKFFADLNQQDTVLSVAAPEAFGFLGPKPDSQGIQFNGSNLAVGALNAFGIFPGSVSVVGRDGDIAAGVQVTGGSLTANFGQINLASVSSGGELNINTLQESPNINGQSFTQMGHIQLGQVFQTPQGPLAFPAQVTAFAGGEQGIVIRGGVLTVEGGSTINSVSTPLGNGNVSIHADSVSMKDFSFQFNGQQFVPVQSGVFTFSLGGQQSGDVLINASSVTLDNFATVGTPSFNLPGFNLDPGAGAITFEVDTLTASNFAQINSSTTTAAPAGNITIRGRGGEGTAAQSVSLSSRSSIQAATFGNGDSGNITVHADTLTVNNASISAESGFLNTETDEVTAGTGAGGNITIEASTKATLSNGAVISADTAAQGDAALGPGAGTVLIRTPELEVNAAEIRTQTIGNRASGNLIVEADHVSVNGGSINANTGFRNPQTGVLHRGRGQAGNIIIRGQSGEGSVAQAVEISNFGTLQALTRGDGNGGSITITSDLVKLSDFSRMIANSGLTDDTGAVIAGQGNAGAITITAQDSVTLANGSLITSSTVNGQGGTIDITGADVQVSSQSSIQAVTIGDGQGGAVVVNADHVLIDGPGSGIRTDSGIVDLNFDLAQGGRVFVGSGQAGDITIRGRGGEGTAAQSVDISNFGTLQAVTLGAGDGGSISSDTAQFTITGVNTGFPQANTGITTSSRGRFDGNGQFMPAEGKAGDIKITSTGSVRLSTQAGIESASFGNGQGGNITLTAGQEINVLGQSTISAESAGAGNAGNIQLEGQGSMLIQDSTILTNASQADGGNITLKTPGFMIDIDNSTISGSVGGGATTLGANINIDPQWIFIRNHSQILANAFEGQGGNITLRATFGIFQDTTSTISASSQFGTSGTVNVQAPLQNLSGVISQLPEDALRVADLYAAKCAAQKGGELSSFVQVGRDMVPPEPEGALASPLFLENPGGVGPLSYSPPMSFQAARLGMVSFAVDMLDGPVALLPQPSLIGRCSS